MPTPSPAQPLSNGPRPPPRKGPNPLLLLGILVASSITFMTYAEKKSQEQKITGKRPVNAAGSLWMKSGSEGEKIDMPTNIRPVE
ncbi:hypothetical protein IAT38_004473 [Cryptococcus sp. DSM 104549]